MAEEVAEVAEDGEDAVAHVGEHRHEHGRLLVGLDEGPPVQAAVSDLKENKRRSVFKGGTRNNKEKKNTFLKKLIIVWFNRTNLTFEAGRFCMEKATFHIAYI